MNKTLLKINKDVLAELSTLDLSKVYLFEIEVGSIPLEDVKSACASYHKALTDLGIKAIISVVRKGIGAAKITELKKYLEEAK